MDIETLKETLGDEKFAALKGYVEDLVGQRDAARRESIEGRKGLKQKLETLESTQTALLEKLGLDSVEDLENLPDVRGQAEAAKQVEAKIKRLERDLAAERSGRQEIEGKYRESKKAAAIASAMGGHEFVARDLVESYVSNSLTWEGDDLLFKTADGKLVPIADGVAGIAKSRPELLKPSGMGGAGVKQPAAGSQGKQMNRAEFEALPPAQKVEASKAGVQIV